MRTLKFRVWCESQKCFNYIDLYKDNFNISRYVNPKINQFVGLTDSNGTDIYEDDILEVKNNSEKWIVKYEIDKYIIDSLTENSIVQKSNLYNFLNSNIFSSKVFIAGNLIENPEIKNQTQKIKNTFQDLDLLLAKL